MPMNSKFEEWTAYLGTSTIDRGIQKLFVVIERKGNIVCFVDANDVKCVTAQAFDGREHVLLKASDGFDYSMSSSMPRDPDEMLALMGLV